MSNNTATVPPLADRVTNKPVAVIDLVGIAYDRSELPAALAKIMNKLTEVQATVDRIATPEVAPSSPGRPEPLALPLDYAPHADVASIAEDLGIPSALKRLVMHLCDELGAARRRTVEAEYAVGQQKQSCDALEQKMAWIAEVADRARSDIAELAARLGRASGDDTTGSDTTASDADEGDTAASDADEGEPEPPRDPAPRLAAEVGRGLGVVFGALADAARAHARG